MDITGKGIKEGRTLLRVTKRRKRKCIGVCIVGAIEQLITVWGEVRREKTETLWMTYNVACCMKRRRLTPGIDKNGNTSGVWQLPHGSIMYADTVCSVIKYNHTIS